ncbi:MAG TPA: hypothetical protein VGL99_14385 [Chloroflexota bacterium]
MTWRLGLITDRGGHVHLGAVLTGAQAPVYVDRLGRPWALPAQPNWTSASSSFWSTASTLLTCAGLPSSASTMRA